jgi:hypothetical protein
MTSEFQISSWQPETATPAETGVRTVRLSQTEPSTRFPQMRQCVTRSEGDYSAVCGVCVAVAELIFPYRDKANYFIRDVREKGVARRYKPAFLGVDCGR